ncbi:MAG: hydantoinase/oxoprolinase N-terminal domain-containing protein, partial [Anaerolineae bacterium]
MVGPPGVAWGDGLGKGDFGRLGERNLSQQVPMRIGGYAMSRTTRGFLGIDVGGTFTDLVLLEARTGETHVEKILSTPDELERAAIEGFRQLLVSTQGSPRSMSRVIHASTVATNAVIERKGAVTGLITTRGFRDVIEIGRELRYDLYDLGIAFPPPIVERARRREVEERIASDGSVLLPLNIQQLNKEADRLAGEGVSSIAIGFLHSYANPTHEMAAAKLIARRHPRIEVSLSSEVAPEIREYERFVTTAINAYIKPIVKGYLQRLEQLLGYEGFAGRLFIMLSNGGISTPQVAGAIPVKMLESGPA